MASQGEGDRLINTLPLEAAMVLSRKTHFEHPEASRVKIEDAVIVNPNDPETLNDLTRMCTVMDG